MVRKRSAKGSKHHGSLSGRKSAKAIDPQDHPATQVKDPQGGLMQGKQLGTTPSPFPSANVPMSGGEYPGSEIGA